MPIQISGRHLEITDAIREYVEERGNRLFRYFERIQKIQFVLSTDGGRYSAECVVSAPKGGRLAAASTEEGLFAAVDKVVDRMERQITRYKEKLRDFRREESRPAPPRAPGSDDGEPDEVEEPEPLEEPRGD